MKKEFDKYENIIEIPPEIYKRMINKTSIFISSGVQDELSVADFVKVGVTKNSPSEEYYIYSGSIIDHNVGNYLIGYYILKDI